MWMNPGTIREMLERNVEDFGKRDALASLSRVTGKWTHQTWEELDLITTRLAVGLHRMGLKKGQKIAFMADNCIECVDTYLAVHKIGGVFVPMNTRFVAREVEHIVDHSDAEFLVVSSELAPKVENLARKNNNLKGIVVIGKEGEKASFQAVPFEELLSGNGALPAVSISPEDEADLIFTSGTTGSPKGVVLTQANKVANGRLSGAARGQWRCHHARDTMQTAFPFFTSAGISTSLMGWLYYGYSLVLEEKFDVLGMLKTIELERSTLLAAAPSMFAFVLDHPQFSQFDTSSIRGIIFGGAAMPEELIKRIVATWPGVRMFNYYGLTEAGPGGTCLSLDGKDLSKVKSVGVPWCPDQEVRVVDKEGRDVEVGETGEIVMRGPNVMKGYYKNPTATDEVMKGGWLHTGDIGCFDSDRYLYYKDRKKDMIVRGGFNIYPTEVENVMCEHPCIKQCAVLGKPHKKLGEDILAYVTVKNGREVTVAELAQFCAERMADFKCPRDIRIVESLPTNAAGKIDKVRLKIL